MATIRERNGRYQAIVRYKGLEATKTFARLTDAKSWARSMEHQADRGAALPGGMAGTLKPLIERYEREMWPVKRWGDTKSGTLALLARDLDKPLPWFTKANILSYAKSLDGLAPQTIYKRLSYLREVFGAARDLWGAETPIRELEDAITAARRLKIVGDSQERHRRPTAEELEKLIAFVPGAANAQIDMGAVARVLSVLPLRLGELCRIEWADLIPERRTAIIRARKHPDIRVRERNDEEVPLIAYGGVDTYELIAGRPRHLERPFPYVPHSVSYLFIQACLRLKIDGLRLHDLRAHACSVLLEGGVPIPQVAKISGHKNWKTLARHYSRIDPASIHATVAAAETHAQPRR